MTDVIMPQMGESIAEGTVTKWLKQVGDHVKRDEPLFEISTDKVDAEIPSPAAGVLLEILVNEGDTVEINTVVARIGADGDVAKTEPAPAPDKQTEAVVAASEPDTPAAPPTPAPAVPAAAEPESARVKTSPVVRKIAEEHGVDVSLIGGTGAGGRVTKKDILEYIERSKAPSAGPAPAAVPAHTEGAAIAPTSPAAPPPQTRAVAFPAGEREVREKMSIMRKKIAEHMVMSRQTSAHVQTWQECDMSNVTRRRSELKNQFEREGIKLTYTSFIAEAVVRSLQAFPTVNASVEGEDTVVYHKDVNLGIAVALDWGLIVPVVKQAQQMNLLGLTTAIGDLAERARTKRLAVDEVQGGTFTITNPGVYGSLMGAPIINQPQVAILGVGVIKKRPVVIDDAIAIRPIMYLSLSFDHRLIDGAKAAKFLSHVVGELETP
jgi:pyruvate dehydrogenase E2 component (dihydrolipoamide acetyltransferase)